MVVSLSPLLLKATSPYRRVRGQKEGGKKERIKGGGGGGDKGKDILSSHISGV